ncbi:hypothetical protein GGS26DRAFT_588308 [Hypomontagnella submonticulosa]|nr:hypothetical protein GGS26DRAFT_588308 [Hypomontagnella submonticulosa]
MDPGIYGGFNGAALGAASSASVCHVPLPKHQAMFTVPVWKKLGNEGRKLILATAAESDGKRQLYFIHKMHPGQVFVGCLDDITRDSRIFIDMCLFEGIYVLSLSTPGQMTSQAVQQSTMHPQPMQPMLASQMPPNTINQHLTEKATPAQAIPLPGAPNALRQPPTQQVNPRENAHGKKRSRPSPKELTDDELPDIPDEDNTSSFNGSGQLAEASGSGRRKETGLPEGCVLPEGYPEGLHWSQVPAPRNAYLLYTSIHDGEIRKRFEILGVGVSSIGTVSKFLGDQWANRIDKSQKEFFRDKSKEEKILYKKAYPWLKELSENDKTAKRSRAALADVAMPGFLDTVELARDYHAFIKEKNLRIVHPVPESDGMGQHVYNLPELYDRILVDPSQTRTRRLRHAKGERKLRKTKAGQSTADARANNMTEIPERIQNNHQALTLPNHHAPPGGLLQAAVHSPPQVLAANQSQSQPQPQPVLGEHPGGSESAEGSRTPPWLAGVFASFEDPVRPDGRSGEQTQADAESRPEDIGVSAGVNDFGGLESHPREAHTGTNSDEPFGELILDISNLFEE